MRENIYTIEWSPLARKQIKNIRDNVLKNQIIDIIEKEIATDPMIGKPLTFLFRGAYSIGSEIYELFISRFPPN